MVKSKKDNPLNTIGGLSVYSMQNRGKSCRGKYSIKYSVDKVKIDGKEIINYKWLSAEKSIERLTFSKSKKILKNLWKF